VFLRENAKPQANIQMTGVAYGTKFSHTIRSGEAVGHIAPHAGTLAMGWRRAAICKNRRLVRYRLDAVEAYEASHEIPQDIEPKKGEQPGGDA